METAPLPARHVRLGALFAAVLHHGLANMAERTVPCHGGTVVETAHLFEKYVMDGKQGAERPAAPRR